MSNVTKLYTATSPDDVLEQAQGDYEDVVVLGWNRETGMLDLRCSQGLAKKKDLLWLLENTKNDLLNERFG